MSSRIKTGAGKGYVIVSKRRRDGALRIYAGWNGEQFSPITANVYFTKREAEGALHRLLERGYDRGEGRIDIVPASQW
jgi:hypothetical protein